MNKILLVSAIIIVITANGNITEAQQQNINNQQALNTQYAQNNGNNGTTQDGVQITKSVENFATLYQQNNASVQQNSVESPIKGKDSEALLVIQSDDILKKLYPKNTMSFFKHCNDCNKYDENSLRVDFTLTKELCEAIKNGDKSKLSNIILNNNTPKEIREILENCIFDMVNNFKQKEDLECMLDYLKVTNGKNTYSPIATMNEWLKSLECFKDIEDVATEYLKDKDEGKVTLSYELRASFYFSTGKGSYIQIPKKEALSLLTTLKKYENELIKPVNSKKNTLKRFEDVLSLTTVQKDLDELRKDEKLKQLLNTRNTIKEEENRNKQAIEQLKKTRNEKLQKQFKDPTKGTKKDKKLATEQNKLWCNDDNKDQIKPDEELFKIQLTDNNKDIYNIIQEYKKDKEKLEQKLNELSDKLSQLEQECAPSLRKEKELEDKLKNVNQDKVRELNWTINQCNYPIIEILKDAQKCFENNSASNKK